MKNLNKIVYFIINLFRKNMFKKLITRLSGPICRCKKQNLSLQISLNLLTIQCLTCGVECKVPTGAISWIVEFDEPYPDNTVKTDNVIPFKKE